MVRECYFPDRVGFFRSSRDFFRMTVLTFSTTPPDLVPRLASGAWDRLGIGWGEFKRLLGEVNAQRDDAERLLS